MAADIMAGMYEPERLVSDLRVAAGHGRGYEYVVAEVRIRGTRESCASDKERLQRIDRVLDALAEVLGH